MPVLSVFARCFVSFFFFFFNWANGIHFSLKKDALFFFFFFLGGGGGEWAKPLTNRQSHRLVFYPVSVIS